MSRIEIDTAEDAIRALWEAATEHWRGDSDQGDELETELPLGPLLFDSATAYPGLPIKGKDLYRIGVALGFIDSRPE